MLPIHPLTANGKVRASAAAQNGHTELASSTTILILPWGTIRISTRDAIAVVVGCSRSGFARMDIGVGVVAVFSAPIRTTHGGERRKGITIQINQGFARYMSQRAVKLGKIGDDLVLVGSKLGGSLLQFRCHSCESSIVEQFAACVAADTNCCTDLVRTRFGF